MQQITPLSVSPRLTEAGFFKLLNCGLEAVCLITTNGDILFANAAVARVLGRSAEECPGLNLFVLLHPDDATATRRALLRMRSSPGQQVWLQMRFRHMDGSWHWTEVIITGLLDDPDVQAVSLHIHDITERKRSETALRQSESRFLDFFAKTPDAILVADAEGYLLDANDAACRLHGLDREELLGQQVIDLSPPQHRAQFNLGFSRLVSGDLTVFEGMTIGQEHRTVPVEIRGSRIEYLGRQALLLHVRDISERRQAEENVRRLAAFPELNPNPVLELSADSKLTYANQAAVEMARQLGHGQPAELFPAEINAIVQQCLATNQPRVRLETTHGDRLLSWSFYPISAQGIVHCYVGDITERRQLEEHLRQAQKLESIGQLAAGVAHDFNNILTIVQGNASLLLLNRALDQRTLSALEQVSEAAERGGNLTRQLLMFSRKQALQLQNVDLNEVTSNLTKMLGRILGEHISLQFNYDNDLPRVSADAGMLEQVIVNLAVNARDAMPGGGVLRIATARELIATNGAVNPEARPGQFVRLEVTDTGTGIAPELMPRIFEPFFTTKEVGKGTGLGLATVYGIVKQHQGWLEVVSKVGRGTTFNIFLPALAGNAGAAELLPRNSANIRGGTERILVAEDEPALRVLVENILARYGYSVRTAATGAEALQIWNDEKGQFDLLLTDMVMPGGVSGRELASRLRTQRSDLKVIYTSGYSPEITAKDLSLQEGVNYLQKPFRLQKMAEIIRNCLDGTPANG